MSAESEFEAAVEAYRRARWKIIFHGVFMFGCCLVVSVARRFFNLPPTVLGIVFIVALVVFSGDIMRFFRARERLRYAAQQR